MICELQRSRSLPGLDATTLTNTSLLYVIPLFQPPLKFGSGPCSLTRKNQSPVERGAHPLILFRPLLFASGNNGSGDRLTLLRTVTPSYQAGGRAAMSATSSSNYGIFFPLTLISTLPQALTFEALNLL